MKMLEHKGKVRWFNPHFGFGFIRHQNGEDVFFHYSVVETEKTPRGLKKGSPVTYNIEDTNLGLKATKVIPVLE